jgi:hypothetical protein
VELICFGGGTAVIRVEFGTVTANIKTQSSTAIVLEF